MAVNVQTTNKTQSKTSSQCPAVDEVCAWFLTKKGEKNLLKVKTHSTHQPTIHVELHVRNSHTISLYRKVSTFSVLCRFSCM